MNPMNNLCKNNNYKGMELADLKLLIKKKKCEIFNLILVLLFMHILYTGKFNSIKFFISGFITYSVNKHLRSYI